MEIETLLKEEIRDEIAEIQSMDVGSEQHKTAVETVVKLCDRAIELEKFRNEFAFKKEQQLAEDDLKCEQIREDKQDRYIGYALTVLGIAVPAGLAVWGTRTSIKFEETGTLSTIIGRGWFQKLLPRK